MVCIVDYGVGNIESVANAIQFLGYPTIVSRKEADIVSADAIVLPGVGAFEEGMRNLHAYGVMNVLHERVVEQGTPFLGICLGMQVLASVSYEKGEHSGLGWIPGQVLPIDDADVRVPHVGWNTIAAHQEDPSLKRWDPSQSFYFDHSYHFSSQDPAAIVASCTYGAQIVAAVRRKNIFGVQFHPEKSQHAGLKMLRSFFVQANVSVMNVC
jgi:imidazole glycerol-phosphate synthase subunit HisH